MAAVTSEILKNMLRTSLTDLKSFVELLNAVLAEEGQGDEIRASHKDNISEVLLSFGQCEAYLKKSSKGLREVDTKIKDHFDEEAWDEVEENALLDEIRNIIKMIAGKPKSDDVNRSLLNLSINEDKISKCLENVEDILNEFHPLKYTDDDGDTEEEEQLSQQLEAMQIKTMSRLEERMNDVGSQNKSLRLEEEVVGSDDDEEFDYDSLERIDNRQAGPDREAKRNMDTRLKAMWNEYKEKLANVQPIDTNQLFTEALSSQSDVDVQKMKYFSQFNNNILELFSQEAPLIIRTRWSYMDPISKKKIKHPVRNNICEHIYEKDTIYGILKKKKKMKCPFLGCSCISFTIKDLEEDDEIALRITQNSARQRESEETDTEDEETEDESNDSPNVGSVDDNAEIDVETGDNDTENADTQSQELL